MAETLGLLIVGAVAPGAITGIGFGSSIAGATFLGINLATAVGATALIGTSIGLNYALRPGIPKPEDGSQAVRQAVPSRVRGYGMNRLAGAFMLFEQVSGNAYMISAIHSGPIGGIVSYYLNDDVVIVSGGIVQDTYDDHRYADSVAFYTRLGGFGQAPIDFQSEISGIWNSDFRGDGIAYIALRCAAATDPKDFANRYPSNRPSFSVIANCSPVWDPRDASQSKSDPSTWKVSFNPVIQLMDYLTRADGGMGLDIDIVLPADRLAEWMVEADLCDELVDIAGGGTEARYKSSGWFAFDNKPEDIINGILATCDGWLSEPGDGSLSIVVGVYREPTGAALTESNITGFTLNYGQSDETSVNELDITFTDPNQKMVTVQAAPYRDEDAISLAGIVRSQPLDLTWVQSASQASRLAYRAIQRLNPQMTGSFTTTLAGLQWVGRRWVPVKYPFVSGLQNCVLENQGAEIDLLGGKVTFKFIRVNSTAIEAYDPSVDELPAPPIPLPPTNPSVGVFDFSNPDNSAYVALLEDA